MSKKDDWHNTFVIKTTHEVHDEGNHPVMVPFGNFVLIHITLICHGTTFYLGGVKGCQNEEYVMISGALKD